MDDDDTPTPVLPRVRWGFWDGEKMWEVTAAVAAHYDWPERIGQQLGIGIPQKALMNVVLNFPAVGTSGPVLATFQPRDESNALVVAVRLEHVEGLLDWIVANWTAAGRPAG